MSELTNSLPPPALFSESQIPSYIENPLEFVHKVKKELFSSISPQSSSFHSSLPSLISLLTSSSSPSYLDFIDSVGWEILIPLLEYHSSFPSYPNDSPSLVLSIEKINELSSSRELVLSFLVDIEQISLLISSPSPSPSLSPFSLSSLPLKLSYFSLHNNKLKPTVRLMNLLRYTEALMKLSLRVINNGNKIGNKHFHIGEWEGVLNAMKFLLSEWEREEESAKKEEEKQQNTEIRNHSNGIHCEIILLKLLIFHFGFIMENIYPSEPYLLSPSLIAIQSDIILLMENDPKNSNLPKDNILWLSALKWKELVESPREIKNNSNEINERESNENEAEDENTNDQNPLPSPSIPQFSSSQQLLPYHSKIFKRAFPTFLYSVIIHSNHEKVMSIMDYPHSITFPLRVFLTLGRIFLYISTHHTYSRPLPHPASSSAASSSLPSLRPPSDDENSLSERSFSPYIIDQFKTHFLSLSHSLTVMNHGPFNVLGVSADITNSIQRLLEAFVNFIVLKVQSNHTDMATSNIPNHSKSSPSSPPSLPLPPSLPPPSRFRDLLQFLSLFSSPSLLSLIKFLFCHCPFPSITANIIQIFKQKIVEREKRLRALNINGNAEEGKDDTFCSLECFTILVNLLKSYCKHLPPIQIENQSESGKENDETPFLSLNTDGVISTLNVIYFIICKMKSTPIPSSTPSSSLFPYNIVFYSTDQEIRMKRDFISVLKAVRMEISFQRNDLETKIQRKNDSSSSSSSNVNVNDMMGDSEDSLSELQISLNSLQIQFDILNRVEDIINTNVSASVSASASASVSGNK